MIGKGTESKIENVTMPLYKSVIHTLFDYSVLFPSFLKDVLKLKKVQKRAASMKVLPQLWNSFCARSDSEDCLFSVEERDRYIMAG